MYSECHSCPLHPCPLPVVLQVTEYQGGPDWPGGVDRAGPVCRHQRCQRHALVLPAVEEGPEVTQEARQCPAADVSRPMHMGTLGRGSQLGLGSPNHPGVLIVPLFSFLNRGKTFRGTTIGMAPLEGMCSADNSGGVSVVRGTRGGPRCSSQAGRTQHHPVLLGFFMGWEDQPSGVDPGIQTERE